jgi:hypothetical protein
MIGGVGTKGAGITVIQGVGKGGKGPLETAGRTGVVMIDGAVMTDGVVVGVVGDVMIGEAVVVVVMTDGVVVAVVVVVMIVEMVVVHVVGGVGAGEYTILALFLHRCYTVVNLL